LNEELFNGYYQDSNNLQPFSNLAAEARALGINVPSGCVLPESVAQSLLDRANRIRKTESGTMFFRTLEPKQALKQKLETQPTLSKKENTMKLNISRTALIDSLNNYVTSTTTANAAALAIYNQAKAPVVEFVNNNKELVAKVNGVDVTEVTTKMIEAKISSLLPILGLSSTAPTPIGLAIIQSMIAKLKLSTDESIELEDSDPILAHTS
jgi:hypothetical protein